MFKFSKLGFFPTFSFVSLCFCLIVILLMTPSETDKMKRAWTLVCGSIKKEQTVDVTMFCFATKAQEKKYLKKERALASYPAIQLAKKKGHQLTFQGKW